jgi:hypothetical protein
MGEMKVGKHHTYVFIAALLLISTSLMLILRKRVYPGDSFPFDARIEFQLASAGRTVRLTPNHQDRILNDLDWRLPDGVGFQELVIAFWPGDLNTLAVRGKIKVSPCVSAGRKEIAVQLPGLSQIAASCRATVLFDDPKVFDGSNVVRILEFEVVRSR